MSSFINLTSPVPEDRVGTACSCSSTVRGSPCPAGPSCPWALLLDGAAACFPGEPQLSENVTFPLILGQDLPPSTPDSTLSSWYRNEGMFGIEGL